MGLKGCISFTKKKITDYRVYRNECCHDLSELLWYCISLFFFRFHSSTFFLLSSVYSYPLCPLLLSFLFIFFLFVLIKKDMINNGVWMPPGGDEEWTISFQHRQGDIDRVVDAFRKFAVACRTLLK